MALAARTVAQVLNGKSLNRALAVISESDHSLRAAARDLTYNTLRQWGKVDVILERLQTTTIENHSLKALLLVALGELRESPKSAHTSVDQAVDACLLLRLPRTKGLVNAILRNYLRRSEDLEARIQQTETGQYSHADWWIKTLQRSYPREWQSILSAANAHPPMTLRVNRRRITPAEALQNLSAAGIPAKALGGSAIMLDRPCPVVSLPGFEDGCLSVQDAGAQQAAPMLDVMPGMKVLDACAAPGGKSGHILELADCELIAVDISAERARRIQENLQRLRLRAEIRVGDSLRPESFCVQGEQFDRILLDAPCTASGVVRRHPDIRWLRRPGDLETFARTQSSMLDAVWPLLRPDGKLLYTTCSVFPVENALQIEKFLSRHNDARACRIPLPAQGQILPGEETDGFYYELLQKRR